MGVGRAGPSKAFQLKLKRGLRRHHEKLLSSRM